MFYFFFSMDVQFRIEGLLNRPENPIKHSIGPLVTPGEALLIASYIYIERERERKGCVVWGRRTCSLKAGLCAPHLELSNFDTDAHTRMLHTSGELYPYQRTPRRKSSTGSCRRATEEDIFACREHIVVGPAHTQPQAYDDSLVEAGAAGQKQQCQRRGPYAMVGEAMERKRGTREGGSPDDDLLCLGGPTDMPALPSSRPAVGEEGGLAPSARALHRTKTLSLIHQGIAALRHLKDLGRMTSLRVLTLHMNRLTTLTGGALQSLHQLEELDVSGNEILMLEDHALQGLGHLRRLNVSSNRIASIAPNAFAPVGSLQWLSLAFNQLKEIRALRALPASAPLRVVDVCGNELRSLADVERALEAHQQHLTSLRLRVPAYEDLMEGEEGEELGAGMRARENPLVTNVPPEYKQQQQQRGGLDTPDRATEQLPWYKDRLQAKFPQLVALDGVTVAADPLREALLASTKTQRQSAASVREEQEGGRGSTALFNSGGPAFPLLHQQQQQQREVWMSPDLLASSAAPSGMNSARSPRGPQTPLGLLLEQPSREGAGGAPLMGASLGSGGSGQRWKRTAAQRQEGVAEVMRDTSFTLSRAAQSNNNNNNNKSRQQSRGSAAAPHPQKPRPRGHIVLPASPVLKDKKTRAVKDERTRTTHSHGQSQKQRRQRQGPDGLNQSHLVAPADGRRESSSSSSTSKSNSSRSQEAGQGEAAHESSTTSTRTRRPATPPHRDGGPKMEQAGDHHHHRHRRRRSVESSRSSLSSPSPSPSSLRAALKRSAPGRAASGSGGGSAASTVTALPWKPKHVASHTEPTLVERDLRSRVDALQTDLEHLREAQAAREAAGEVLKLQLAQQGEQLQQAVAEEARRRLEVQALTQTVADVKREAAAQVSALQGELHRKGQEVQLARRQAATELRERVKAVQTLLGRKHRSELETVEEAHRKALQAAEEAAAARHAAQMQQLEQQAARAVQQVQQQVEGHWRNYWTQGIQRQQLLLDEATRRSATIVGWLTDSWMVDVGALVGRLFHESAAQQRRANDAVAGLQRHIAQQATAVLQWRAEAERLATQLAADQTTHQEEMRQLEREIEAALLKRTEETRAAKETQQGLALSTSSSSDPREPTVEPQRDAAEKREDVPQLEVEVVEEKARNAEHMVNERLRAVCDIVSDTQRALHHENERLLDRVRELELHLQQAAAARDAAAGEFRAELQAATQEREALEREVRNLQSDLQRRDDAYGQLEEEAVEKLDAKRRRIAELEQEVEEANAKMADLTAQSQQRQAEQEEQLKLLQELQQRLVAVQPAFPSSGNHNSSNGAHGTPPLLQGVDALAQASTAAHSQLQQYRADQQRLVEGLRFARDQLLESVHARQRLELERDDAVRRLAEAEAERRRLQERVAELEHATKAKQVATLEALTQMIRADLPPLEMVDEMDLFFAHPHTSVRKREWEEFTHPKEKTKS
eukprot:gene3835-2715_t